MEANHKLATLSFAQQRTDGTVDLWPAGELGDYVTENDLGRKIANELVSYMREQRAPMVLGHVAKAISESGRFGGREIGFFGQIALICESPRRLVTFGQTSPQIAYYLGDEIEYPDDPQLARRYRPAEDAVFNFHSNNKFHPDRLPEFVVIDDSADDLVKLSMSKWQNAKTIKHEELTITITGPQGSGKSVLARELQKLIPMNILSVGMSQPITLNPLIIDTSEDD